jgi:uncharacterized protein
MVVVLTLALQLQAPEARVYRAYQAGAEVARETYRASGPTHEFSTVVPVLNLRVDTRLELADGRVAGSETRVLNAAGDSLRVTITMRRDGDSLLWRRDARGVVREGVVRSLPDGLLPPQSVAAFAFAAEQAAGRDTTLRLLPIGSDTTLAARVEFRAGGDTAVVHVAGLIALTPIRGGRAGRISIPVSGIAAELWNGSDSLPPLAGLRRPPANYDAPPGAPYTAEHVTIPVRPRDGDPFTIAATLTKPAGVTGRLPVVVTISGSGQQDRDEDLWPVVTSYRPFRQIAERLAAEGIAVLRYDDRAAGGSGGALGTSEDYADDLRQIVAWLRARADIDPRRVALLGHSEGGVMGPLVAAADPAIAALVVMAGPGKSGAAIVRDQFTRPIETAPGLSAEDRQRQLAAVEQRLAEWVNSSPWSRFFATYDPLATARRLRQPVLILQGALDRQVSAGQADTLAAAVRAGGNRDVTVRVYPRLNHLFLVTDGDGSPQEYGTLRDTALPAEVLDQLASWLRSRLRR